jgi:tetratricopeptide (TPR) repeat protein
MVTDPLMSQLATALGAEFVLERELGGGGMSRVFVARDDHLGRQVVVKVLSVELTSGVAQKRFAREIRLAARLQEPHIVPVLSDGVTASGQPYYLMPFVEGPSLREMISAGPIPRSHAAAILHQVAQALAYAHQHDVVHRDIKPENILVSSGTAMVADFGIAKALSDSNEQPERTTLTEVGNSLGTPAYMSPEQATGDVVTASSDLYSWGVIGYELLSGAHPFAARKTSQQMMAAHVTELPAPLPGSDALSRAIMTCLAKEPNERPASAAALLASLDHALTSHSGSGEVARSMERTARFSRRWWSTRLVAAAAMALTVVALSRYTELFGVRSLFARGSLSQGDALVLATFEGGSDSTLANAVTEALRVDLSTSSAFRLVDLPRVRQLLGMMRHPPTTRVTASLAREVAIRAGVAAVVEGEVAPAGSGYVLIARIVRADSGQTLAAVRDEAANDQELVAAIDRLSGSVRAAIGESLRSVRADAPLSEVTTASLPALRLYTRGRSAFANGDPAAAVTFFREAVAIDTGFAMAWRFMGPALQSSRSTKAEWHYALTRAYELRQRLPPNERALTEVSYHDDVSGDVEAGMVAHRHALELKPDDHAELSNYGRAMAVRFGKYDVADSLLSRSIAVLPSFPSYSNLVWVRILRGDMAGARRVQADFDRDFPGSFWRHRGAFMIAYHSGESNVAHIAAESLAIHPQAADRWRSRGAFYAALADIQAGRVTEARRHMNDEIQRAVRNGHPRLAFGRLMDQVWIEGVILGDTAAARRLLQTGMSQRWLEAADAESDPFFKAARDAARIGATDIASAIMTRWRAETNDGATDRGFREDANVISALTRAARGNPTAALTELTAIQQSTDPRFGPSEWPSAHHCERCYTFDQARIAQAAQRPDLAITFFERVMARADDLVETPLNRLVAAEQLGALYEAKGDTARAVTMYGMVRSAWAGAEPPLDARAKRVSARVAALSRTP